jgi:hypothetical protein
VSPMASRWIIITEPVEPFRDPLIAALAFPLLIPFVSGKCDVAQLVWNVSAAGTWTSSVHVVGAKYHLPAA